MSQQSVRCCGCRFTFSMCTTAMRFAGNSFVDHVQVAHSIQVPDPAQTAPCRRSTKDSPRVLPPDRAIDAGPPIALGRFAIAMRHRPGTDRFEHGRRRIGRFGCYLLGGRVRTDRAVGHLALGTWLFGGGEAAHPSSCIVRGRSTGHNFRLAWLTADSPFRKSICQAEVRAVGDVRKAGPAPTVTHRA